MRPLLPQTTPRHRRTLADRVRMDPEQCFDLRKPRLGREVGEVNRVHAHMSAANHDHAFEGRTLQAHRPEASVLRKQVVAHRKQRRAGEQHVPELPPPAGALLSRFRSREMEIDPRPVRRIVLGKAARDVARLIDSAGPGPETLDLLERDHVGSRDLPRDAVEIEAAVAAPAILDVVGDDLHRRQALSAMNVAQPSPSSARTASVNPSSSFARTTSNRARIDGGAFETTHARSAHSSMSRSL